jgi:uncharacterized protein
MTEAMMFTIRHKMARFLNKPGILLIMSKYNQILTLNVGFIVHETVGYFREFDLEAPRIHLYPDLDLENFLGLVKVTRTAKGLLIQAKASAKVMSECVRCLNPFLLLLEIDFTDLYAFSPDSTDASGLLLPENGKIDLEPSIREEMLLSIPINPICSPNCKGLCPICGENLNTGEHIEHHEENPDSSLSILKSLLDEDAAS